MINLFAVFIGGGIGTLLRYVIGILFSNRISYDLPCSTFSVNIIACFIIGMAVAFFYSRTDLNPACKLAITVGFCGGLSTFSTLSVEVIDMLENNNYFLALGYILLSVAVCLLSTFLGIKLGSKIF